MKALSVNVSTTELRQLLAKKASPAMKRAMRKAGATALRDMRAEATKRIRRRKRIRGEIVRRSLQLKKAKGGNVAKMEWVLQVRGTKVPLSAYPHRQRTKNKKRAGVYVEVNRGKKTLLASAFIGTTKSGHLGIFVRRGAKRLPIDELLGSRPVDALLHEGESEAVLLRGQTAFLATFQRVLPMELDKAAAAAAAKAKP